MANNSADVITSVSGLMFHGASLDPSFQFGFVSLAAVVIALLSRHVRHLAGPWRWVYVIAVLSALYLNVHVALMQALLRLAPAMLLLSRQGEPPFVAIQPEGTAPPLFVLHSASGSLMFWRALVNHLSPDQPVVGLRPAFVSSLEGATDDSPSSVADVESAAARFADRLCQAYPDEQTFRLAGYSFGGLLAYETARQLEERGRRVALLAIIDMPARFGRRPVITSRRK